MNTNVSGANGQLKGQLNGNICMGAELQFGKESIADTGVASHDHDGKPSP